MDNLDLSCLSDYAQAVFAELQIHEGHDMVEAGLFDARAFIKAVNWTKLMDYAIEDIRNETVDSGIYTVYYAFKLDEGGDLNDPIN